MDERVRMSALRAARLDREQVTAGVLKGAALARAWREQRPLD